MKKFMYESDVGKQPLTLERVLELMGNNFNREATYLIPDLQREYVWDSKKIINLIDTLMKGWPFGQILVANTGKMSPLFSPRTFFSKVIMFGDERGETMDAVTREDTATLVLDGQQRLQSLFLAVAPCSGGLVQDQRTWISEYHAGNEYRLWSGYKAPPAFLAVNLENLAAAYNENQDAARLDYSAQARSPLLEWVFKSVDSADGKMWERRACLPKILESPWEENYADKYILLNEIWDAKDLQKLEQKHGIDEIARPAFEAFCECFRALKEVPVPYLRVLPREECVMNEDEYNEMILSIFSRLNAGGKTLTEEEITYSWIKRYWPRKDIKAEDALDKLRWKLTWKGITLKSGALVRILSNIWSVFDRGGRTLTVGDMLDGSLLKSVSTFLGNNWDTIENQLADVASMLEKHNLHYGTQYYSLQGYELLAIWSIIARIWQNRHSGARVSEHYKINDLFAGWMEDRLDRFVFACQWANSLGNYCEGLSKLHERMKAIEVFEDAVSTMSEWFEKHLRSYVTQAKVAVNDLKRTTRAGVGAYTTQLWCWQRLTKERMVLSEKLAKEQDGVTTGRPNVEHCVSCAFWEEYLDKFDSYPKGSDVYNDMLAKINQIGNCNILCKSVNCSKNSLTMCEFWSEIGFRESDVAALNIPNEMFRPDHADFTPERIMKSIDERTLLIRKELCAFLDGDNKLFIHR